ncbi:DUF72 domain-containing protein [Calycomorphotria hydatis]|uniref:DUF72 domain-containing protein n=1 Tax=Calycomorphotria hydatis TaxID=2528027 RepID=A0A517T8C6_9PLAN|nr:DUF72 domain-containing protein [Calycomorphotria hydatis]QDT64636.1 hypothetical protein V22_18760 [Calycomorphotria hydatis]
MSIDKNSIEWRLGTAGYNQPGWKNVFYPRRMPQSEWLRIFSTQFNTVELNTTFYHIPAREHVLRWADQVDDDFEFCVKTWRGITHDAPLKNAPSDMEAFLDIVRNFGSKLGVVLLQLGPDVADEQFDDLRHLLTTFPDDMRFAVEFRHPSWYRSETDDLLREHNIARVAAELEKYPIVKDLTPTTDFLYIRLLGRHNRFPDGNREMYDPTELLTEWSERIWKACVQEVKKIYLQTNNGLSGYAPKSLRRMADLLGVSLPEPTVKTVKQGNLFDL